MFLLFVSFFLLHWLFPMNPFLYFLKITNQENAFFFSIAMGSTSGNQRRWFVLRSNGPCSSIAPFFLLYSSTMTSLLWQSRISQYSLKRHIFTAQQKPFRFIQRLLQFYSTVPPMITFHKIYKLPTLPPLKAYALLTTVSLNVTIFYGVNKDSSLLKWLPLLWLPLLLMTKSVQRHTLFKHILSILKPRNLF